VAKGCEAHLANNGRFYAQAFVLNRLLTKAAPQAKWWERLQKHVSDSRFVDPRAMGFPSAGNAASR